MAHEIAHNLNAPHDSLSIGCDEADRYIMASVGGEFHPNNYYFSPCSIESMKSYLLDNK